MGFLALGAALALAVAASAQTPPRLLDAPEVEAPADLPAGDLSLRLQLSVDAQGQVTDAQLLQGLRPDVDARVLEAARRMRFTPAQREGQAVSAVLRFRYRLRRAEPPAAPRPPEGRPPVAQNPPAPRPRSAARAPGRRPLPPPAGDEIIVRSRYEPGAATRESFRPEELTTVPGTFGEPLRVVGSLPGVGRSPLGVGFFLVRGASFENTGFMIDGFPVLNLYHLGAGPSVLSPFFVSGLDFYPGNYPLSYGRFSAGIISVRTDVPAPRHLRLITEVDLFRASAVAAMPFADGRGSIAIAGRRSYYDLFLRAIVPGVDLNFGDAQARVEYSFSRALRGTLFAFTSSDTFSVGALGPFAASPRRSGLNYNYWRAIGRLEYRGASGFTATWGLMAGWDRVDVLSSGRTSTQVSTLSGTVLGQRFDVRVSPTSNFRMQAGVDALGQVYSVVATSGSRTVPATDLTNLSVAAYLESTLHLDRLELTAGARFDYVHYRDVDRMLGEPRMVARVRLARFATLVAATGLFHQQPNALLMVAGFALPPQRAWQNSVGVEFDLGAQFDARITGYYNQLWDLPPTGGIVPSINDPSDATDFPPSGITYDGQGRAYGLEFFLRRRLERGLYGWLSYTLSRSERWRPGGAVTLFNFDQPHVVNLAVSWKINEAWRVGARFQFAMGTPTPMIAGGVYNSDSQGYDAISTSMQDRNPPSHQLDVRVDHLFRWGPFRMNAYLDIINVYNAQNGDLGWSWRYDYTARVPGGGLPILPTLGLRGEL